MAYITKVNSTSEIAADIETFSGTVTSIDDITMASHGGNNVAVLIDYSP